MKIGTVTGAQLAFFTLALLLLTAPLALWAGRALGADAATRDLVGRLFIFGPAALVIFGIPPLRRHALALLRPGIPSSRRPEVLVVAAAKALLFGLAAMGALALWHWHLGGEDELLRVIRAESSAATQMAQALSPLGVVKLVFLGCLLAPVLEELVIRGFLYRAWERQWGVWPSMLLTSALFAVYHTHFFAAFTAALIFVSIMRRTGSLWASIAVHAASNLALWYPLMGQFIVPRQAVPGEGLALYSLQLTALAVAAVAIPYYVWLGSRGGLLTSREAA